MKKIFAFLVAVLLTASVFAQSPEKMSYQAVIRNSSQALVTNAKVGMKISILQDSESGTAVYAETHTPTTNVNGLVSIEIGTGTVVSGSFSAINWAKGLYFIKTETDPTGGTNYTITGTSQLLSVPYALFAKTAETVKGGIAETDPLWKASPSFGITNTDITNWNNRSIIDGSETKLVAGTDVTVTGNGTTGSPYVVKVTGATKLTIGQSYQGGIIFWLDETGQHGLIAAKADQSAGIKWNNGTEKYTGTTGDGLYAGAMNTAIIVAAQMADNPAGNFAAKACADYSVTEEGGVTTYGDWYLPSLYELNLLYQQKDMVGGFASVYYWSSKEDSATKAVSLDFDFGTTYHFFKTDTDAVRAVRAF